MNSELLPTTVERVPRATSEEVNQAIRDEMVARVRQLYAEGDEALSRRLVELDREWDTERTLEANASALSLVGLALGITVDRRFLALPLVISGFLLQHALQGWCPPLPILRQLGVRTSYEIEEERYAIKALRGDFTDVVPEPLAPERALEAVSR